MKPSITLALLCLCIYGLCACGNVAAPEARDAEQPRAPLLQDEQPVETQDESKEKASPALDYIAHITSLKKRLPHDDFHIVIQKPFVVIGDEPKPEVERWSKDTVKWAVDHLKKSFFAKDPDHIIDVWLFKDNTSYRKHCRQLFKHIPTTPYGFYSPKNRALVMNIATGGGTLVHEIVHPFVAANFPNCPSWFNEGLGSLFEQCKEREKMIVGMTNWRLAGLQEAIREGSVPSFKTLTSTTDHEFYQRDPGTNYSQARYICYYLQEKGLLRRYYKAFLAARKTDPTGYATLKTILKRDDIPAFKVDWEKFVQELRY